MLARINSSLTAGGPRCSINTFEIVKVDNCPQASGKKSKGRQYPQKRGRNFIIASSALQVFVAYLRCSCKSRIIQQCHISSRSIHFVASQLTDSPHASSSLPACFSWLAND